MEFLLKDGTHVGVRGVYGQRYSSPGNRVSENRNCGQKEFGGGQAVSNVGFHWRDLPGPLRALVRGARTQAAERRKRR